MKIPYIGITGFMKRQEIIEVMSVVPKKMEKRKIMIGVLASGKTLKGGLNKYPNHYPPVLTISQIFLRDYRSLNLIHYHTEREKNLEEQLLFLTALAGPNCQGFQLNMAWPDPASLERFHSYFKTGYRRTIVLQIGSEAFAKIDYSPDVLTDKITGEYCGLIDYILLDLSGGKEMPFNPEFIGRCLHVLSQKNLYIGIGIAGGLGPDNVGLIASLIKLYPDLSWDAEGRLRDENGKLDLEKTKNYLIESLAILKK